MFAKLEDVEKRYEELNKKISDPEVISKQSEWQKYMKEHSSIIDIVEKYREYKKAKDDLEQAREMLNDKELKELAEIEMEELREKLPKIEEELNEREYKRDYKKYIVELHFRKFLDKVHEVYE